MMFNDTSPPADLDAVFAALAHPIRRALLDRLQKSDRTVGELAEPFDVSLMAVSKHLAVLERAGLIEREDEGRYRRCRLREAPLREATAWLAAHTTFWNAQLDSLSAFLEETDEEGGS